MLSLSIAILTVAMAGLLLWKDLHAPLNHQEALDFTVPSGMAFTGLARKLQQSGLVDHTISLRIWARFSSKDTAIKTGEYLLEPGLSSLQVIDKIVRGDVKQYRLTLVEGWTLSRVLAEMQANPRIVNTLSGNNLQNLPTLLGVDAVSAEGLIFPDTYSFSNATTDIELLRRAHSRLQTILEQAWTARAGALPLNSAYEALILASIVEKETAVAEEREQIAGVFIRRLENGMRLQSDPTVIYGLGDNFSGDLRRDDLQDASNPYNTYRNNGLPPTPIALAGLASINAVLHPDASSALYFVAKGDGTHYFSSTLEEHNQAVRRYQLGQTETR